MCISRALVACLSVCSFTIPFARPALAQHKFIGYDAITIPHPGVTMGTSAPYPDPIPVTGVRHPIGSIRVVFPNFSHTYPDDLDIVLVSPRGLAVVLMSDAGGSSPFSGNLFFDAVSPPIPDSGPLSSFGIYSPADYEPGDAPPGLPSGLTFTTLAGLRGSDANGFWSLYVYDDAGSDTGQMDPPRLEILEGFDGLISIDETLPQILLPDQINVTRTLTVAGLNGPIRNLVVRLYGLTHTYPRDLDIALVAPSGQQYILMSDAGGTSPVSNISLDFGSFPTPVPEFSLASGQYLPSNYTDGDPTDAGGILLTSAINGSNASGPWTLRIFDDAAGDSGSFTGWSLVFDGPCKADFDASGSLGVQDIFAFLTAWFSGCP